MGDDPNRKQSPKQNKDVERESKLVWNPFLLSHIENKGNEYLFFNFVLFPYNLRSCCFQISLSLVSLTPFKIERITKSVLFVWTRKKEHTVVGKHRDSWSTNLLYRRQTVSFKLGGLNDVIIIIIIIIEPDFWRHASNRKKFFPCFVLGGWGHSRFIWPTTHEQVIRKHHFECVLFPILFDYI